jgi:hypothetical protein
MSSPAINKHDPRALQTRTNTLQYLIENGNYPDDDIDEIYAQILVNADDTDLPLIKVLLDAGADPNEGFAEEISNIPYSIIELILSYEGMRTTTLNAALSRVKDPEVAELLLNAGANNDLRVFVDTLNRGASAELLRVFLRHGTLEKLGQVRATDRVAAINVILSKRNSALTQELITHLTPQERQRYGI